MKLKLQLLLLVFCAFLIPAQLLQHKKHDEHGRDDKKVKPGEKPEHRPGQKPEEGPGHRPGEGPGHRPGEGPGLRPGEGPGHRPGEGPGLRPGEGPGHRPGEGPGLRPGEGPGRRPGEGPGLRPGEGPGHRPGEGPGHRPGEGPGHRPGERPGERGHEHDKKPERRRGRVEDLLADYDDSDDSRDDDDEGRGEWLFELQDVRGSCSPNPCLNNGICEDRRAGRFKCKCPKHFRGRRCEKRVMICKRDTCGYGQCVLTLSPPYYECKCKPPFKPPNCKSIAPCEPNPCLNGGSCVKDGQDFDCVCKEGFTGRFCHVGPDDCYEGDGESYRGMVSETEDGDDCLFWHSHFILGKGINPFTTYEDARGLGPHNCCRNPDGESRPWCFIRLGKKLRWDHCNVRKCSTNETSPISPPKPKPPTAEPAVIRPPAKPTPVPSHPTQPSPAHPSVIHTPGTHPPVNITPESKPSTPALQVEEYFATCGKPQPKRPVNRIYGGLKALPGAQPWQASVQVRQKGTSLPFKHICGGILIKPCWVMTAGHCIDKKQEFQVVLGSLDLGKIEASQQVVEVVETIIHEQYRETLDGVYNDIALLRLKDKKGKCVEESQFVKTACLPTEAFPDGAECTISGWGATPQSQYGSSQLLDAEVLLISQDTCSSSKVYGKLVDHTMFCAGYLEGGVDSCQGDSGGPLTCARNQTHYIYGIVSWGDNCGEKNKPGVYTRVTHFVDWINAKTASKPSTAP
ncbi:hyaluronan-binding protein 2-like [Colossoma macropomum]|uniref:hyaluronan-binding protein 2-like n=1 Tax=Colossoma macropomum TaxID=42526 RepID=UPI0018641B6B|nr:hyaluronan-binding protein 2-like [Colossoma macropomum]